MEWLGILAGGVLSGGALSAVLVFFATRKRDNQTAIAERFDDASELAKYIDERVEAKVKPIRDELEAVKRGYGQIKDAFRAWVMAVWLWARRTGTHDVPMPPAEILERLNLSPFVDEWPTEPSEPQT